MASSDQDPGLVNRLAEATSPYLRQHADNPVAWQEWTPETLDRAVRENKPLLLSVGYSACHWCHVMAHESFEDDATAEEMNRWFINVKLDREERPDVDAIYQKVVALMGQGGGWPLTVFLTPDQRPFYGGTYFPNEPRYGRPSFRQVLGALHEAWEQRPDDIEAQAKQFTDAFADLRRVVDERMSESESGPGLESAAAQGEARRRLLGRIDEEWGGLGRAPKFPNVPALELLLDGAREESAGRLVGDAYSVAMGTTLERMWRGGIYDHLRGGFARYSVDREWLVPHFEKMLYDNALLLGLYADASVIWPERTHLRRVVTETVGYLVADMQAPDGTFYSATDADSEGVEGKFFCWTPDQVGEVLDDADFAERFALVYGVTPRGNFEHGMSILHLPRTLEDAAAAFELSEAELSAQLGRARSRLLEHRYTRVPPLRDEKILTAWNGLLISGLCRASQAAAAWGNVDLAGRWRDLASKAATRLVELMTHEGGGVWRAAWEAKPYNLGYLDDLGALGRGYLDLYELTLDPKWRDHAVRLATHAMAHHARPDGGFFFTADDAPQLLERTESRHDSPMPSGVALVVECLARLELCGGAPEGAAEHVQATLSRFATGSSEPFAYAALVRAARWLGQDAQQVTLRGPDAESVETLARLVRSFRVNSPHPVGLEFIATDEQPNAVTCRGQTCSLPTSDLQSLRESLRDPPAQISG
jgi:hypothetical protein